MFMCSPWDAFGKKFLGHTFVHGHIFNHSTIIHGRIDGIMWWWFARWLEQVKNSEGGHTGELWSSLLVR